MSREYGGFLPKQRHKLIEDSLMLLSTYMGAEDSFFIHESEMAVGGKEKKISEFDDITQFVQARFLLAKWLMLKDIIGEVDASLSSTYEPQIIDYIGKIQGTLVVSQYIAKKWNNVLEKRYPCLVSSEEFDTPENAFLCRILLLMYKKLKELSLPVKKSEANISNLRQKALIECANMSRHPAFNVVSNGHYKKFSLDQLYMLVKKRNSRGQTGNVRKFSALLKWYETLNWSELIANSPDKLHLVFGQGSEVWDKIFEIWILTKLIETLSKKDYKSTNMSLELVPLTKRLESPIAILKAENLKVEVYFQNSSMLESKWTYNGDKPFRGIPDTIVKLNISDFSVTILIDVKNIFYNGRENGNTEKYKMLGYFENFKECLLHQPIGILLFRNDENEAMDILTTKEGAKLYINTVSPSLSDDGFVKVVNFIWDLIDNHPNASASIFEHESEPIIVSRAQEAHSLAQSLATQRPDELLRCKDELKRHVFPTTWDFLPLECQTLLGMAELLYQNLQQQLGTDPDVDWGPAVLEYCRATEYFLNHKVIIPFTSSSTFKQILRTPGRQDIRAYSYITKGTLTFGELSRFFMDLRKSSDGIFSYIQSCDFLNDDMHFWKSVLWNELSRINIKYRRKSAHIDLLKHDDVVKCRSAILGSSESRGLLTQLIMKSKTKA